MVRTFLVRGMLVGIVAGLLSFGFLKVYGEPQVDRAIAFETEHRQAKVTTKNVEEPTHAHGHASNHTHMQAADEEEPELVSRPVQAGLGLFVAMLVYSVAFGGLFGLAHAFAAGRLPGVSSPQGVSALLAIVGFVSVYLVPNLKYPANPPAIGEPDTIGARTALYFTMIAISLAAMIVAMTMKRAFVVRVGEWNANLLAAACYIVLIAIAALLLPTVSEVPDQFPADVLWKFRIASIGAQLIMWGTLGLLFGALTQRAAVHGGLRA
ncbi:MAG TPA: CbtA family protein [Xanthobacteraceae bacterium]|nr:CbtA family protein [Xanthobacteraceae bacterium]